MYLKAELNEVIKREKFEGDSDVEDEKGKKNGKCCRCTTIAEI